MCAIKKVCFMRLPGSTTFLISRFNIFPQMNTLTVATKLSKETVLFLNPSQNNKQFSCTVTLSHTIKAKVPCQLNTLSGLGCIVYFLFSRLSRGL